MIVPLIAQKLQEAGHGVQGKTIFAYDMPATAKTGILVKPPLQGIPIDHYLPGYYETRMQVIVRALKQEQGEALARAVMQTLTIQQRTIWAPSDAGSASLQINQFLPTEEPIRFPRLDGDGIEWSLNFHVSYVVLKTT